MWQHITYACYYIGIQSGVRKAADSFGLCFASNKAYVGINIRRERNKRALPFASLSDLPPAGAATPIGTSGVTVLSPGPLAAI